jgi:hypothetical protein
VCLLKTPSAAEILVVTDPNVDRKQDRNLNSLFGRENSLFFAENSLLGLQKFPVRSRKVETSSIRAAIAADNLLWRLASWIASSVFVAAACLEGDGGGLT